MVHLALEKALKALVVKATGDLAPSRGLRSESGGDPGVVDPEVIRTVRRYLSVLREHKIPATRAVLYGSHARGTARPDSDIDVLVVSPAFDLDRWSHDVDLWRLTLKVDARIEPVPVGQVQLLEDRASPIVEMARREGLTIDGDEA